jgi:outer membrane protein OmpA-like peptidoglycan-associated protein
VSEWKAALRRALEGLLRFVVPVGTLVVLMVGCPWLPPPRPPAAPVIATPPTFPMVLPSVVLNLPPIYFDTDRADLDARATAALITTLAQLKSMASPAVTIVAYCDERGTVEHNQRLADARARTVREYLAENGYEGLLFTLPVGRSTAFCSEPEESCWKQNRRTDLLAFP